MLGYRNPCLIPVPNKWLICLCISTIEIKRNMIPAGHLIALHEKCPNTEFFLVCIFPYSDWIRTRKNSVFGHISRCAVYCLLLSWDPNNPLSYLIKRQNGHHRETNQIICRANQLTGFYIWWQLWRLMS